MKRQSKPRQTRPAGSPRSWKSRLGAMAKAGSTNLVDVVKLRRSRHQEGFVFMDTPGYDPVAATGQVAGGANLVCFTNRPRAACSAASPHPRSSLRPTQRCTKRMEDDMDVNLRHHPRRRGNRAAMRPCAYFDLMLKTASGQPTKSESFDFGGGNSRPGGLGATM